MMDDDYNVCYYNKIKGKREGEEEVNRNQRGQDSNSLSYYIYVIRKWKTYMFYER